MREIPTPQLIRIPDPTLAPIDSLTSEAIDPPNHSQETSAKNSYGSNQSPAPAKNTASRSITSADLA